MMIRVCALLLLACTMHVQAISTVETFEFPDEATRVRYQGLVDELRCPKCQNTNLSGSDATIAKDLRVTVYRLVVTEGRSDDEVRDFLVARYGDFVLYNPPFRPSTWLLWFAPLIALMLGGLVLRRFLQREPVELDDAQRAQVAQLLKEKDV